MKSYSLKRKNMNTQKLASNPTGPLQFAKSVTFQGKQINLADPKSTRAMIALMDMNAVLGGAASHFGGPSAFAELMSATFGLMFQLSNESGSEWHQKFNFVNDAGHCENGLYALRANYGFAGMKIDDLKKFRSIDSKLTGHGEAHLFPEAILLSNGPLGSAFPQAQGLAMSDKKLGNSRITVVAISDGASMEGEARESFAAIPGFAKSNQLNPFVMIISDNNTKLSGRIDKESFSMTPTFDSLSTLGWKVIKLAEGHDLQKCTNVIGEAILEASKNPQVPIAIHAKTIKGYGTQKTAQSSSGAHGFPLKSANELNEFISEIYQGEPVPMMFTQWIEELKKIEQDKASKKSDSSGVKKDKIQLGITAAMIKAKKAGLPIVSITSDLPGSTGVAGFRKEFPNDSFDVGVAESNMVSVAAGFSKNGFIPVVDTFAQFGVTKGALPLTMASLSNAPIICVFSHTGFQDAADGASHQSLTYLAQVSSIPNVEVYTLSCAEEAEILMYKAISSISKTQKSYVFFLGRENFPLSFGVSEYGLDKPQVFAKAAAKVAIVASGSMLAEALEAQKKLMDEKIHVTVINPVLINRPNVGALKPHFDGIKKIVYVDDHQEIGGMAERMVYELSKNEICIEFKSLAVKGEFGQSAYTAKDLYKKHGIDSDAIVRAVKGD
jgi:transketolase